MNKDQMSTEDVVELLKEKVAKQYNVNITDVSIAVMWDPKVAKDLAKENVSFLVNKNLMNNTQEYILQKSVDNLIKMVDKLNKDLETVGKEADYYHSMYLKYKQMYQDLLFHETGAKDSKPRDPTGLQNLLIYEAGVEDGIAKAKVEQDEKKDSELDKFCSTMDSLYGEIK
jgi:hypothetical protein